MTKIIISGCNGRMGHVVARMCSERNDMQVVGGFDVSEAGDYDFPVFKAPLDFTGEADVVVDFSNPAALPGLLDFCVSKKLPVILCTTGYSEEQLEQIRKASEKSPVFKSGNMSLGINLLVSLCKKAASVLGDNFDVEIVERHHKMKVDAPSGTAIMLADALAESLPHETEYVYERQSTRKAREKKEIGISAVRGGTIVGDHQVIFAGPDEVIELRHIAQSREVFANGALAAAKYMHGKTEARLYDMNDALAAVLG